VLSVKLSIVKKPGPGYNVRYGGNAEKDCGQTWNRILLSGGAVSGVRTVVRNRGGVVERTRYLTMTRGGGGAVHFQNRKWVGNSQISPENL